jgi:hypothetical protein
MGIIVCRRGQNGEPFHGGPIRQLDALPIFDLSQGVDRGSFPGISCLSKDFVSLLDALFPAESFPILRDIRTIPEGIAWRNNGIHFHRKSLEDPLHDEILIDQSGHGLPEGEVTERPFPEIEAQVIEGTLLV